MTLSRDDSVAKGRGEVVGTLFSLLSYFFSLSLFLSFLFFLFSTPEVCDFPWPFAFFRVSLFFFKVLQLVCRKRKSSDVKEAIMLLFTYFAGM